jgi:hypothetical protein
VLDSVNLALTKMFNRWGDRVVVVARVDRTITR